MSQHAATAMRVRWQIGGHVKAYFQDLDIQCWEPRHEGTPPSLCLFVSQPDSCGPLLRALDELESAGPPAKRTLTLKPCDRRRRCSTIRLILSIESDDLRQMNVARQEDSASIEITSEGLQQFRNAVQTWHDGADDFGISPTWDRKRKRELGDKDLSSLELWFWGPYYAGP